MNGLPGRAPKLDITQVHLIRRYRSEGATHYKLALQFKTSTVTIWKVLKRMKPYNYETREVD